MVVGGKWKSLVFIQTRALNNERRQKTECHLQRLTGTGDGLDKHKSVKPKHEDAFRLPRVEDWLQAKDQYHRRVNR